MQLSEGHELHPSLETGCPRCVVSELSVDNRSVWTEGTLYLQRERSRPLLLHQKDEYSFTADVAEGGAGIAARSEPVVSVAAGEEV